VKRLLAVVATCCAFAAVAVVASAENPPPAAPGIDAEVVEEVQPEAEEAVATLEEPRTAIDEMANGADEVIAETADYGANPDLSQLAVGTATHAVYLVPANDRVCIAFTVGEKARGSCFATESVAAGEAGPMTVLLEGGAVAVLGIVPDEVDAVDLDAGTQGPIHIDVVGNVYYRVVPAATAMRSVSYEGPSGHVAFDLVDPRNAFDE
jgi:hypothetical protein